MRGLRRQVKHVAGRQQRLFFGLEMAEDLERQAGFERQVLLTPVAPFALAGRLQQEYVIAVEVRTDAAAMAGDADHHVVQARVRDEAELLHQLGRGVAVQVDALHQQGPVAFVVLGQAGEGAVFHLPCAVLAPDQARFDVVAARKLLDRGDGDRRLEIRDGLGGSAAASSASSGA